MKYTTVQDAAAQLGVTERTIRYRIDVGLMKATRYGRAWLIPTRELERWRTLPAPKRGPKVRNTRYTKPRTRTRTEIVSG